MQTTSPLTHSTPVHAADDTPCGCSANGITKETVAVEAASGKAFLHSSPDVNGRPVIIIRVQKHVTSAYRTKAAC